MRPRPLQTLALAAVAVGVISGVIASLTLSRAEAAGGGAAYVVAMNVTYWGAWAVLMPAVARTAAAIRNRNWRMLTAISAHSVAAAGYAALHLALVSAADLPLGAVLFGRQPSVGQFASTIARTQRVAIEWEFTMYGGFVAFVYATELQTELRRRAVAQAQLEANLAEARLLSLQRQLQPHFLFNTLHAVTALLRRDPDTAETMIVRLSQLLRTSFKSGAAAEVPLSQDLASLSDYLAIESAQMRERLSVTMDIAPDALSAAVPVLLLQPLVENAVRHGLQPRASGGRIRVSAAVVATGTAASKTMAAATSTNDSTLMIEIADDGIGLTSDAHTAAGVGIANTQSRLRQLYGDRHSFVVAAVAAGGVSVRLSIPFRSLAS